MPKKAKGNPYRKNSMGPCVVFLQYLDDVKRVNLPAAVTSLDTLKALFVTSFPDRISLQDFEDGVKVVYIKDGDTGTYYMLEDVSEVLNRSFLKIHEKSPSVQSGSQTLINNTHQNISSERLDDNNNNLQPPLQSPRTSYSQQSLTDFQLIPPRPDPPINGSVNGSSNSLEHAHEEERATGDDCAIDQSALPPTRCYTKTGTESSSSAAWAVNSTDDTRTRLQSHSSPYDSHVSGVIETRPPPPVVNGSYTPGVESVEDQLDDLTELLKSALDEEEQHHAAIMECVNTKNPGKLDPSLIAKIQSDTQTSARKNTLPKYFQPTIMVAAQQESDRRTESTERRASGSDRRTSGSDRRASGSDRRTTSERSTSESSNEPAPRVADKPAKPNAMKSTTSSVKMKMGKQQTNNNESNAPKTDPARAPRPQQTTAPPTHKQFAFESYNSIDGAHHGTVHVEEPQYAAVNVAAVEATPVPQQEQVDGAGGAADMSMMSDTLMEQIMDMEQEVKARSTLSISRSGGGYNRSSTDSSCPSSSIPEKLNASYEDSPKPESAVPTDTHNDTHNDTHSSKDNLKNTIIEEEEVAVQNGHHTTDEDYESAFTETSDSSSNNNNNSNGPSSMQHVYASISKVTTLPTKTTTLQTKIATPSANSRVTTSTTQRMSGKAGGELCHHASVTTPDFIELEDSARNVHASLNQLRDDLAELRKCHVDGVRSFNADIQKKLLVFRKKAARVDDILQQKLDVNNNIIFANEHPVRERRHRLTDDQLAYNKKMSDTQLRLKFLEGDMEKVRISVVNKKRVENPQNLKELHEELTQLTKGLAEIKNRFHGLHDMLKIVMPDEIKIVNTEERFLKDEPQKLETLIGRCKVLSGTLFTLERLASVQLEQGDQQQTQQTQQQTQQQQPKQVLQTQQSTPPTSAARNSSYSNYSQSASTTAANYNYHQSAQIDSVFDIEDLKGKRSVRFSSKN